MRHLNFLRTTAAGLLATALAAPGWSQGMHLAPLESREALENLMPAAELVARARYGDSGSGSLAELGLGNAAAPFAAAAHANWTSKSVVDLRVTFDGFGRATFVVGTQALAFDCVGAFEALGISARAQGAGASARLFDVTLNGVALAKGAKAVADDGSVAFDGTLVQGAQLRKGFVLRGKLRFTWAQEPVAPGALLVELRVGRMAEQMQRGCESAPNSTGIPARIEWWGVTSVSSNKLTLAAVGGPPSAACIFLVGGTQQSLPYGNGTLCVGPPIDRLSDPLFLDAEGSRVLAVDLTQGPLAGGLLAVQPGDTRTFQVWYRDPGAGADAFDLTDSLTATFLP